MKDMERQKISIAGNRNPIERFRSRFNFQDNNFLSLIFSVRRLIDVCFGPRQDRELVLYLVFEHLEQDLASYMQCVPPRTYIAPNMVQVRW